MWFYADSKMAGTPKPVSPLIGGSPKPMMVMPPKGMVSPKLIGRPPAVTTMKLPISPKPMMVTPKPMVMPPKGMMVTPKPISPILVKPPTSPKPIMMTKPVSPKPIIKKPISPLPNMPTKMISIPKVKYTLNQKPVVFEKVCKQVGFEKVPIQYEFEKQVFPVKVVKKQGMCNKSPCGMKMGGKFSPKMLGKMNGGGKISPMVGGSPQLQHLLHKLKNKMSPKHYKHGGSPGMFKIPCAMKTSWNFNRSPCDKDKFVHPGQVSPPCSPSCKWPRWQSSYVKSSTSPCMTAMTSNCNKKFCSQC